MKKILRYYLINLGALWVTTQILPALSITQGLRGLLIAGFAFMLTNILLVPLLKIILLPLNLLTLGIFAWLSNVLALYFLVSMVPSFKIEPYYFPGIDLSGFSISAFDLTTFHVAIVASLLISLIVHFVQWLTK